MMEILELFSGYASWSSPFQDGKNVITTLDYDCRFGPTICQDILTWDYEKSGLRPDVIFASPDCTYFSVARARWGYPEDKIEWTRKLWERTFEIIDYFKPRYYLIENPVGKARHFYDGYRTIDYCMYGYQVKGKYIKKSTDLWTNIPLEFRRCDHSHEHHKSLTDVVKGKALRAIIPEGLTNEIFDKLCVCKHL